MKHLYDTTESSQADRWQLHDVPFKFQLGDRTLCSVCLRLQVREVGLTEQPSTASADVPPTDPLTRACQGFLVRSLPVEAPLPVLSRMGGYLRYVSSQYPRFYIELNTSFADYVSKFSSKTRSTINRKIRKFTENCGGSLQWRVYKRPDDLREFHRLARAVSAKTYQEKLLDAGMPASEGFLQEMLVQAESDAIRGYILFHGDAPVAYLYCPSRQGVLLYEYLGYDPAYREWSVGTVLQWLALEDIFREGKFRIFDFTEGESDHKRLFGTHHIQCANVFFLRDSLRNELVVRAQLGINAFSTWAGDVLERHGLKARIKRLMRFA